MISTCVSPTTVSESKEEHGIRITLRSLRAQNDGAEIQLQFTLENGTQCEQKTILLTTEQYTELKPRRGEISEELYESLEAAGELCRAIRSGESLLSYGANSTSMLTLKLMRKGYSRETATAAAQKLLSMGLIDEVRDACREVDRALAKLWGRKRIRDRLYSRGFSSQTVREAEERLSDVDFADRCATLIRKHYATIPDEADELRRMMALLSRYGYSVSEIRAAITACRGG